MIANTEMTQALRELGMTNTEAEVYLATLAEAVKEPVSGYKVAQSMGRDPANMAKTLSALEKMGAVQVIQKKPKLYLPVQVSEFADILVRRLNQTRERAVSLAKEFESDLAPGMTLALRDSEMVLARAASILSENPAEVLLFAAPEVLHQLNDCLASVVATGCSVYAVSTSEVDNCSFTNKILPGSVFTTCPESTPWLQMVVDRKTWLLASLPDLDQTETICGWWSENPALSQILAATLISAWNSCQDTSEFMEILETELAPEVLEKDAVPADIFPEPTVTKLEESPTVDPGFDNKSDDKSDDDSGEDGEDGEDGFDEDLQFIIKHEDD